MIGIDEVVRENISTLRVMSQSNNGSELRKEVMLTLRAVILCTQNDPSTEYLEGLGRGMMYPTTLYSINPNTRRDLPPQDLREEPQYVFLQHLVSKGLVREIKVDDEMNHRYSLFTPTREGIEFYKRNLDTLRS